MKRLVVLVLAASVGCSLAYPLRGDLTRGDAPNAGTDGGSSGALPDGAPVVGPDGGAPSSAPILMYGAKGGHLRMRRWVGGMAPWSAAETVLEVGANREIRQVVPRRLAVSGRDVVALYTVGEGGSEPRLAVFDWDGQRLVPAFEDTDIDAGQDRRPFDVAWDGKTGRALAVYGGAQGKNPKMRVRTDAGWGPEQTAFAAAPDDNTFAHMELVTRPGTDDVTLLYADSDAHLWAARFDGTRFEKPVALTQTVETNDFKAFAGAYEQQTGDLVIAWAENGVSWSATPKGAPTISTSIVSLPVGTTGPIALAADPGSDRIALASIEINCGGDCDDFTSFTWSGAEWSAPAKLARTATPSFADCKASAPTTVAWLGGKAIAPFDKVSTGFQWSLFDGASWALQPEVKTTPAIGIKSSFVAFHPSASELVMLVEEASGKLWAKRYDGTSWSDTEGGAPLADDLPDPAFAHGVPFGADVP